MAAKKKATRKTAKKKAKSKTRAKKAAKKTIKIKSEDQEKASPKKGSQTHAGQSIHHTSLAGLESAAGRPGR